MTESEVPEQPTELEAKVIRQIEFYFGDFNLGKDKFLQEQIKEDNGWVPLETMIKFNRLKSLTTEFDQITAALKKSQSGLMEISEDQKKIRRSPEMPLPTESPELKMRSVYVKGFPMDATLDQIMDFFRPYAEMDHIHMRRDTKRSFKGSVFAVFPTEEATKKFLETEDLKYNDTEMIKYYKEDYFKKKKAEVQQHREEKAKAKEARVKQEKDDKILERMTKGAILKISGLPSDLQREELKEFWNQHGKVHWADFAKGDTEGKMRFDEEGSAGKALEAAKSAGDGKVVIKEAEVECYVLEGDEEIAHWKDLFRSQKEAKENKRQFRNNKRRGGGRGGRGGRYQPQGRKTRFDSDDEGTEPPAKKVKDEGEEN